MSAAFNEMTAALETQRELRRRLINDVSHELNTPLSVILLEARGLRDGLQTPEEASGHIIEEVERLRGLVTDLNWLAETDHGELRLTFEESPVHELLAEEVERWQPQAQARQVELSMEVARRPAASVYGQAADEPGPGQRHRQCPELHRGRRERRYRGGTGKRRSAGYLNHR